MDSGKFDVIKITKLKDLVDGVVKNLPESDLSIQTDDSIVQFKFVKEKEIIEKTVIKTGCYSFIDGPGGLSLIPFELREHDLLKTIINTKTIISEVNIFLDRLDVYKTLNKDPKRAVLLCSPPGVGKSASINQVCQDLLEQEGTCVTIWDTTSVNASSVNKFFLNYSEFDKSVKRLILVIEDISGGSVEDEYGARGTNSALLNLLDGVGSPFKKVPTFIIATTNNPEREIGALIDRPGRFDKVIELNTPNADECVELLEFIAKRPLTEEDKQAALLASQNDFSIAHLQEVVVRSMLDGVSLLESCKQLVKHKERFKNAFQDVRRMGIGIQ